MHFQLELPFNSTLFVAVNISKQELEKLIGRLIKDKTFYLPNTLRETDLGCYFAVEHDKTLKPVIWIREFSWRIKHQACLVHELTHFVMDVFDLKGIPISKENGETFAYFLENTMNEVYRKLKKLHPNQIRKKKSTKKK